MNQVIKTNLGLGWGLGTYKDGEGRGYGYPVSKNPLEFTPDIEVCTDKEIQRHDIACHDAGDSKRYNR